jgi:hypothetical protein
MSLPASFAPSLSVEWLVSDVREDSRSPSYIDQFPVQSGQSFLLLGVHFLAQCLGVSQKFLPLFIPVHSCVLFPPEFRAWPAHRLFPAPLASLLLIVARLSFYVHEIVPRGRH